MSTASGMKQARPKPEEFDAVCDFLYTLEALMNGGVEELTEYVEDDREAWEYLQDKWETMEGKASWQRVLFAGNVAIENACDPNASTLEWKPEIAAALARHEPTRHLVDSQPELDPFHPVAGYPWIP